MLKKLFISFILCFFLFACTSEDKNINDEIEQWLKNPQLLNASNAPAGQSVILVHGFAGTPYDLKPLADGLAAKGYRVVVPLLPGQNIETYSKDSSIYTPSFYTNWLQNLATEETKVFNKKPFLVGFSMGGTISTIVASKGSVEKLALISPFFSLPFAHDFVSALSHYFSLVAPNVPKFKKGFINDPESYEKYQDGSDIVSLKIYDTLKELASIAEKSVPEIKAPILLQGSENDEVASFAASEKVFKKNKNAIIIKFNRSDHIILHDYDKEAVISNVVNFLQKQKE